MRRILVLVAGLAGCVDGAEMTDDPRQVPPLGGNEIMAWLEAGTYNDWHCQPAPHPASEQSPHTANRICNNDALYEARDGEDVWPVGAASVKEVFRDNTIVAYAAYRKVDAEPGGDSWFWYEGNRESVAIIGQGAEVCVGCHTAAARDFVFTVVP
jgi:hypothetical protein